MREPGTEKSRAACEGAKALRPLNVVFGLIVGRLSFSLTPRPAYASASRIPDANKSTRRTDRQSRNECGSPGMILDLGPWTPDSRLPSRSHGSHQVEGEEQDRQNHRDSHPGADPVEEGIEGGGVLQQAHAGAGEEQRVRHVGQAGRPERLSGEDRKDAQTHSDDEERQEADREEMARRVGPPEVLGRDRRYARKHDRGELEKSPEREAAEGAPDRDGRSAGGAHRRKRRPAPEKTVARQVN